MTRAISEYARHCSTQAKRAKLVRALATLTQECGATIETSSEPTEDHAVLAIGPYRVNAKFNGRSKVGAFLGHWFTDYQSDAKYPAEFGTVIGGSINTYHFRKATTIEDTFEGLKRSLRAGLERLAEEIR